MTWRNQWPGKSHQECPYGFKIDAFRQAQAAGIRRALWLDCSVWAVGPLEPAWQMIDERGVLLIEYGGSLGEWTSDAALEIYGISREQALEMPICYALLIGLDLESDIGCEFLDLWQGLRDAGAFVGPWENEDQEASADPRCLGHRHDQSAASFLAHELGIGMVPINEIMTLGMDDPAKVFRAHGLSAPYYLPRPRQVETE